MLRIQDKRVRIIVAALLLAITGYAIYQGTLYYLTGWHYDAALAALQRYDYDEAAGQLKSSLALRPTDPETLLLAAQVARRRNSFDDAADKLRLAEKHGAPREPVETERKLLIVQRGELADSPVLLGICLENPDGPKAALILEALIEGSMRAMNPILARDAIDLWLKHRPSKIDQAQGLVWRGRSNLNFNQPVPPPQDDFQQAVELAPDHFYARLHLAATLIATEPKKAIPHLDWLRQHRPDDLSVRFQLARFYRKSGQPEEAARTLDELIAFAPNEAFTALVERGSVALELKRTEEAEQYLRKALAITPLRREVNLAMADCMRQQQRLEEARAYQDKVDAIDAKVAKMAEEWKKLKKSADGTKTP